MSPSTLRLGESHLEQLRLQAVELSCYFSNGGINPFVCCTVVAIANKYTNQLIKHYKHKFKF